MDNILNAINQAQSRSQLTNVHSTKNITFQLALIGHLCSKESRYVVGTRADLCHSQGRVHGWAVEGLHRPREEARDSTKKSF